MILKKHIYYFNHSFQHNFFGGCIQEHEEKNPGAIPLEGWLFILDNNQSFFVTTPSTYKVGEILNEEQVKKITDLNDFHPILNEIQLTVNDTNKIVSDYLVDLDCIDSFEIGGIDVIEYRNRIPYLLL